MATRSSYDQRFFSARGKELGGPENEPHDARRQRSQEATDVVLFDLGFLLLGDAGDSERSEFLKRFLALLPCETRFTAQALRAKYTWEEIATKHGQSADEVQRRFRRDVETTLMKLQADLIDERHIQEFTHARKAI